MKVSVQRGDLAQTAGDLLVLGFFENAKSLGKAFRAVDEALDGLLKTLVQEERFEGKESQILVVHTHGKIPAKRLLLLGLGRREELTPETIRRGLGTVVKKAKEMAVKRVISELFGLDSRAAAEAIAEGAILSAYHYFKHKGEPERQKAAERAVEEVVIVESDPAKARAAERGVAEGTLEAEATIYARDLVNEPSSHLTPRLLAEEARQLAQTPAIKVQIYDRAACQKLGLEAFLGVARGSEEEPQFIHLTYKPSKAAKRIALVGKGITFDTGGVSIKKAESMTDMKLDMAGAAAVLGVFRALKEWQPAVEVHGIIAATENMISGKALKPGDVLMALNGKTIEVLNTDAEGRLTLADALSFAVRTKPDVVIDLATLTGSIMVGLGESVAGMFTNSAKVRADLEKAAALSGELFWPMPIVKEYKEKIKSPVADLKNISGGKYGDTVVATLFLQEFVGQTPWAHLDIAGPAWEEHDVFSYVPKGGTGFGVRTLLHYLRNLA